MQSKTLLKTFIAASLLAVSSLAASAATVNFTFNAASTATSTDAGTGLSVTVSSKTFVDVTLPAGTRELANAPGTSVLFTALGLGMQTGLNASDSVRSTSDGREALDFAFSSVVKLLSVTFNQRVNDVVTGTGVVFINGTGNSAGPANPASTLFTAPSAGGTFDFSLKNYVAANIGIAARPFASGFPAGDFFISAISVEYNSDTPPPAIPVPAAGLMLGSLVLLPLLRRKRRAA